jgi:hypothetical protein
MSIFNFFKKSAKANGPYNDEVTNKVYELLFCDNTELYRPEHQPLTYPDDVLFSGKQDVEQIKKVANDKSLPARIRLLAYKAIQNSGNRVDNRELLGTVIEVALPEGLDVLAAYSDGTARYVNQSGKLLVWEDFNEESNKLIEDLLANSINVVSKIGPWDKARRPFPQKGFTRLSFLVSDGLYFGEGPFDVLTKDEMAAPVIASAYSLMNYLISKQMENQNSTK